MNCSPPNSSVHRILQAGILEWAAISFSRGSSRSRDQTQEVLSLLQWQAGSLPLAPPGKHYFSIQSRPNGAFLVVQWVKNPPAIQEESNPVWVWVGLGRSSGEGIGYPLQYSYLENTHGQRSLWGYSPWGPKELDMTEQLSRAQDLVIC